MRRPSLLLVLVVLAGCGKGSGEVPCGIAALAGPTALLNQFSVPRQTLSMPPARLPEHLVARLAAGPAVAAVVGRTDSGLVIGVQDPLPAAAKPTFGVLVVDLGGSSRGIMLYEGMIVEGAPRLGVVSVGSRTVPLLGLQLDPTRVQDANCPFFPDSVLP